MTTVMMLLDIAAIIVAAKLVGQLAGRIGQPPVVGEIAVGVAFAAVVRANHHFGATVLSTDVRSALKAIATVGLVLFMFTVGYHWEPQRMRGQGRATFGVAAGSMLVPFGLGIAVALWLASRYQPADRPQFLLFIATTMSITALPVLARIVDDRRLRFTNTGGIAIASAAAVDALSWGVLAVIVALVGGRPNWHLLLVVPYLGLLIGLRPAIAGTVRRWSGSTSFGMILAALFFSAAATEWLGLHYVFGAFLFGALLPRQDVPVLRRYLDDVARQCHMVLLPVFFVVAALDVNLAGIGLSGLGDLGVILLFAVGSKLGGAYLGARLTGMRGGEAAAVATLMNARGVTELVVLQVGLQLGVIDGRLYSLLVLMALVTTAATGPLLALVGWHGRRHGVSIDGITAPAVEPEPAEVIRLDPMPASLTADRQAA